MTATARLDAAVKKKFEKIKTTTECPIELLRAHCLARGACGIKGLARAFSIMDDDGDKKLDRKEFRKGLRDYGVDLANDQSDETFDAIDTLHLGYLNFDEFLLALRPPMTQSRKKLVVQAFRKLDKDGDGVVTVNDLHGVYNATKHPKYLSGQWTEDQVLTEFLESFEISDHKDGNVTPEEFMNYYAGISASIDNDAYFDLMMRHAWKL